MKAANILVLGGGGAVGQPLARLLAEQGHTVTVGGRTLATLTAAASRHPSISAALGDARMPAPFASSGPTQV